MRLSGESRFSREPAAPPLIDSIYTMSITLWAGPAIFPRVEINSRERGAFSFTPRRAIIIAEAAPRRSSHGERPGGGRRRERTAGPRWRARAPPKVNALTHSFSPPVNYSFMRSCNFQRNNGSLSLSLARSARPILPLALPPRPHLLRTISAAHMRASYSRSGRSNCSLRIAS